MDEMKHRRLQEMDRSDFEIVEGEPDIRGWDVKNSAGLKIGEVEELIIDAQQKKVRYMVVDLDDKDLKLPDRKVLIPIGLAELHDKDDDVILPTVTVDQLGALPDYDEAHLDDDIEQRICTALGRTSDKANALLQAVDTTSQRSNTDRTDDYRPQTERHTNRTEHHTERTERPAMEPVSQPKTTGTTDRPPHQEEPPIGSAEYYGNFYQHAMFNDYNLYRQRQQQSDASRTGSDPDYERGLRLWEMRAEGGIIPQDASQQLGQDHRGETNQDRDMNRDRDTSLERRMEMVRNRRRSYEERRGYSNRDGRSHDRRDSDHDDSDQQHHRRDNTIIGRIRDEGLQDG